MYKIPSAVCYYFRLDCYINVSVNPFLGAGDECKDVQFLPAGTGE